MDWKKLGVFALAGFGAYALIVKYGKKEEEESIDSLNASGKIIK